MRLSPKTFIATFLALVAPAASGQSTNSHQMQYRDLSGEVTLVQHGPGGAMKDASNVVVWLVPQTPGPIAPASGENPQYQIVQHNKMFEPNFLVVPVGSVVDFPNLDPWFHNVFSLYRGKKFDLGLYEAGSHKQVKFDRPGASYIFCNIHPEMTAIVLAVDSPLFGISDKAGRVKIANVPPGTYLLRVWYDSATPQVLQALERRIEVGGNNSGLPLISISVTKQSALNHKNKYGQDYDPESGSPVY